MSNQEAIQNLKKYVEQHIIGQENLVDRMLIALLSDGHLLVEGAPGLAKTKAIKVLSDGIQSDFHRIQFTPDLLPADLTGTEVYRPQDGSFIFQQGPLFHNLILADEINRAPAKVQSALLEAMAERQITVGKVTYNLPQLFMVMATQNPIEQEGTYPLPEAQLDRFLMHVTIDYPEAGSEKAILALARDEALNGASPAAEAGGSQPDRKISQQSIFDARREVLKLYMAENLEEYLLHMVLATRNPGAYGDDLAQWSLYGASPRATIAIDRCARAHAWLAGRDYVDPDDIQSVAYDVLRHRIILSYEAEAEGVTPDMFIRELISRIAVP
ncbi:MAG: MoxR family ATPase [Gammaproteobacteria bacterium]|nr:MoxR family ATPase [Gammaproteobacteria bacterium]NNL06221.1 MoxR family ATPase [Gammaproteobacteria bacterium]